MHAARVWLRCQVTLHKKPQSLGARVFNCTGLGAKALFDDQQLEPVRGQLEVLLPQPEIDDCYLVGGCGYMFPRRDGIVLGGTWDHGDWSLTPKPEQTTAILVAHAEIMKGLKR
jgi:D-amino-acid oxidase